MSIKESDFYDKPKKNYNFYLNDLACCDQKSPVSRKTSGSSKKKNTH